MNFAEFALKKNVLVAVLSLVLMFAGIISYEHMGRLEYPTFTIKTALVMTQYPGASPKEVEEEVSDVLEEAVQSMGQVDEITSISQEGLSIIYVDIKDDFVSAEIPQIWDELRKKVSDALPQLPMGVLPSQVIDDFGDVYGVFFAITGKGYSYAELKDYADFLKKELLLCENVAKINFWGLQQEVIYVEFEKSRLSSLGITPDQIFAAIQTQNLVAPSGKVEIDGKYLRITPTGDFTDIDIISDLLIGGAKGVVRLGDIAGIKRGYEEPSRNIMRFNSNPSIGLGISTVAGGNVITMGDAVNKRLQELEAKKPLGIEINEINFQSKNVTKSVDQFIVNLVEAVVIVVALLMLFMGWRSGLLIGFILLLTILCTFVVMLLYDIELQKISLGALILALGMLVDNAIVIADGILVRVNAGQDKKQAALKTVFNTQWPLFGATIVAVLAFAAIGFSSGSVGEFCVSLFYVMAISLSFSWILAVTITPLLCIWIFKGNDENEAKDAYDSKFYRIYREFLCGCMNKKWRSISVVALLLFAAVIGFSYIPQSFFPDSSRPQFIIDFWKPQGTHIDIVAEDIYNIEKFVQDLEGVENTTTFIGEGALRFVLTYEYQTSNSSYAQVLVKVDDYRKIDNLIPLIEKYLRNNFPDSEPYVKKFSNGPSVNFLVEARFRGPDEKVLNELAFEAMQIIRRNKNARDVRTDWRQPVRVVRPEFSETQARMSGVYRNAVSDSLQWNYSGSTVGFYREKDELLPIISRAIKSERDSIDNLLNIQVKSQSLNKSIPIGQVVSSVGYEWEYPLIRRKDREKTITVQCNPLTGLADTLRKELQPELEKIKLPAGYSMEWGGEFEESSKAQAPLKVSFPLCMLAMFMIIVWLFNSIKKPLIIFLCLPLSMIGIAAGLLTFGLPFGFMAILGFLGLSGMLIKNAIVLIDQIDIELKEGKSEYDAVVASAISRVRPVVMASGTTVLGMLPLITDPFYSVMAATIMSGLVAATALTLIVVPVFYVVFYKVETC